MASLKDEALSCTFASTMWKAERLDTSLAKEVARAHNTSSDMGRYHRKLFPGCDAPLKAVLGQIEAVRSVHEYFSVPWPPSRAVKITGYPRHRDATKEAIGKFDIALQAFYDAYPTMVTQGLKNSNGLSSPSEYIDRDEIFTRFSVTITYGQIEDAAGWLNSPLLTPEQAQELVIQSQASQQRLLDGVLSSIKDQLAACFKSARENLSKKAAPMLPNAPKVRFNVAWLANLHQLAEMLPSLNLANDPMIPALLVDLQPVLKHTPETMRTSLQAQSEASACIDASIAKYADWLNS